MVLVPHAPVRVLIASRNPAWSAATAGLLAEPDRADVTRTAEEAIAALAAGDHDLILVDPDLGRVVAASCPCALAQVAQRHPGDALLTDQERVVLRLMRQHLTYKEIAQRLGVSWHTVRTHAQSILRKRGVHSRRELESVGGWIAPLRESFADESRLR